MPASLRQQVYLQGGQPQPNYPEFLTTSDPLAADYPETPPTQYATQSTLQQYYPQVANPQTLNFQPQVWAFAAHQQSQPTFPHPTSWPQDFQPVQPDSLPRSYFSPETHPILFHQVAAAVTPQNAIQATYIPPPSPVLSGGSSASSSRFISSESRSASPQEVSVGAARGTQPVESFPDYATVIIPYEVGPTSPPPQSGLFRDVQTSPRYNRSGFRFVQQRMYRPPTNSDRVRYVDRVALEEPIFFIYGHSRDFGIPLIDALQARTKDLVARDEKVLYHPERGPSISIRIEWPCYRSWSNQIPTRDFRNPPGPITREKLAKNVAKQVERFIKDRQDQTIEDDSDPVWRVGYNGIKLEDLTLVSLHHVSRGSWQPNLRLRRILS